jgi:hypothetical protein
MRFLLLKFLLEEHVNIEEIREESKRVQLYCEGKVEKNRQRR